MTQDIHIRTEGRAGRITLNRPKALNALTWDMCLEIENALDNWALDEDVHLILIDAIGEKAFCAGGDIAEMYAAGTKGDYAYGQRFWSDEYRMNAKLFDFPKPVVSFLQGFTMGGGVGVGCHGSHRIVCDSSRIAMPECAIGLVPDVGGTLILARAPGYLGAYLGTTGHRCGPGDAIYAGFADYYLPEADWPALKSTLIDTGDVSAVDAAAQPAPDAPLRDQQPEIDRYFAADTLRDIARALAPAETSLATQAKAALARNAPLAMACAVELVRRLNANAPIQVALSAEYRFTFRALEHSDFIEGIRAAIIDKDRSPRWKHNGPQDVPDLTVSQMLRPLGPDTLTFTKG